MPPNTEAQEKHLALDDAIKAIANLKERAKVLLFRITGEAEPTSSEDLSKEGVPTLKDTLDHGPGRIRKACDEVNQVLGEIDTALF